MSTDKAVTEASQASGRKTGIGRLAFFCPLLLVSLWLPWYEGEVDQVATATINGWETLDGLDALLVAIAIIPVVLAGVYAAAGGTHDLQRSKNALSILKLGSVFYFVVSLVAVYWLTTKWMKNPRGDEAIHVSKEWGFWVAYGSTLMVGYGSWQLMRWLKTVGHSAEPASAQRSRAIAPDRAGIATDAAPSTAGSTASHHDQMANQAYAQARKAGGPQRSSTTESPSLDAHIESLPEGFRKSFHMASGTKSPEYRRGFEASYRRALIVRIDELAEEIEDEDGLARDVYAMQAWGIIEDARKPLPNDAVIAGLNADDFFELSPAAKGQPQRSVKEYGELRELLMHTREQLAEPHSPH